MSETTTTNEGTLFERIAAIEREIHAALIADDNDPSAITVEQMIRGSRLIVEAYEARVDELSNAPEPGNLLQMLAYPLALYTVLKLGAQPK